MYTISKKSWHYRIVADIYRDWQINRDFCGYWRQFFLACIIEVLLCVFYIALFAGVVVLPITFLWEIPELLAVVPFVVIGVVEWRNLMSYLERKRNAPKPYKEPNIFQLRYKAWKEDMCPVIKFEE